MVAGSYRVILGTCAWAQEKAKAHAREDRFPKTKFGQTVSQK